MKSQHIKDALKLSLELSKEKASEYMDDATEYNYLEHPKVKEAIMTITRALDVLDEHKVPTVFYAQMTLEKEGKDVESVGAGMRVGYNENNLTAFAIFMAEAIQALSNDNFIDEERSEKYFFEV